MEQLNNILMAVGIFYGIIVILMVASQWKIFEKAGQPGWAVLIPIYSLVIFLKIIKKEWTAMFLLFIPFYNIVVAITWTNLLS